MHKILCSESIVSRSAQIFLYLKTFFHLSDFEQWNLINRCQRWKSLYCTQSSHLYGFLLSPWIDLRCWFITFIDIIFVLWGKMSIEIEFCMKSMFTFTTFNWFTLFMNIRDMFCQFWMLSKSYLTHCTFKRLFSFHEMMKHRLLGFVWLQMVCHMLCI